VNRAIPVLLLVLTACGKAAEPGAGGDNGADARSNRPLAPKHLALVTRFAKAIAAKDYRAAFAEMSDDYRSQAGWDDFEKSAKRYRESTEKAPDFTVKAGEDNPKDIPKGLMELFVPVSMRGRVVEEAVIHFTVKEDEGFWACFCWIVEDPAGPKILQFAQDD
jgi:hypothetical protein